MTYLVIVVVLLAIIAPILAILPSKRQKEQMALRRIAMAEGLSVEITQIDDPDPDPSKYLTNTGKPLPRVMSAVAYRFPRPRPTDWRRGNNGRSPSINYVLVRRKKALANKALKLPEGWALEGKMPDHMSDELSAYFLNNLLTLPDDVVRVDEIKHMISIYWNERGGEEALSLIVAFIKGCAVITPFELDANDDP